MGSRRRSLNGPPTSVTSVTRRGFRSRILRITLAGTLFAVSACAGLNPNPGERSVDTAWTSGNYHPAFELAKKDAERGEPWAQLRLGIFYDNGWGVARDPSQAVAWYEKVIAQRGSGGWSNGQMIGALGEPGHFNENSDALIAEFNLAQMLFKADGIPQDLPKAYVLITDVIKSAGGQSIFFCCEFAGGRYFNPEQYNKLQQDIEGAMTPVDRQEAEALIGGARN